MCVCGVAGVRGALALLCLALVLPGLGAPQPAVRVDAAGEGIALQAFVEGKAVGLLKGLRYEGRDAAGAVFTTGSIATGGDKPSRVPVSGPGANHVTVTAAFKPLPRGCRLEWTFA